MQTLWKSTGSLPEAPCGVDELWVWTAHSTHQTSQERSCKVHKPVRVVKSLVPPM